MYHFKCITYSIIMDNKKIYEFKHDNEMVKVFLPKFELDKQTMKQIKGMMNNTVLSNIRIMPDCHCSVGCVVGLTAKIDNRIVPRYVGVDIGCGISLYPIEIKLKDKKIPKLEELIKLHVPMGDGKQGVNSEVQVRDDDWIWLIDQSNKELSVLKEKYKDTEYNFPEIIDKGYILNMIEKVGGNYKRDLHSLGSLGGGNHYFEVNTDDEDNIFFTVHSGSRNIGFKVCKYHQCKIDDYCKFNYDVYEKMVKKAKNKIKSKKEMKKVEDDIMNKLKTDLHPLYLEQEEMVDYLLDMIICQNIASLNRAIMIRNVVENLGYEFNLNSIIETKHNYIDFKRFVLRKGSISAEKGERCIISLNMRDGILLCEGLGNPDWNYSSAHGCGRLMSRRDASRLDMKKFTETMKNVYSTSVRKETLDESPMAYKDVDLIKECLEGSVKIVKQLRPVINCKGWST